MAIAAGYWLHLFGCGVVGEQMMKTTQTDSEQIGETVAATHSVGNPSPPDRGTASDLAASRLEQVLLRGCSAHLVAALRGIADELSPTPVRATEPSVRTESHG